MVELGRSARRAGLVLGVPLAMIAALLLVVGARGLCGRALAENFEAPAPIEANENDPVTAPGGPGGMLEARVINQPEPMVAEGGVYLVYELYLTNFQTLPIELERVHVSGPGAGADSAFDLNASSLAKAVRAPGTRGTVPVHPLRLEPGETRIVLLWLGYDSTAPVPKLLGHTITYHFAPGSGGSNQEQVVESLPVPVAAASPVVIGPPLRGGNWFAGNAPSSTSPHRQAYLLAHGRVYFPERYAIDFVRIGADGHTYAGDPKENAGYHAYNQEVLAVADGTVVAVKDGIPDNTPGSLAVSITLGTIGGNCVILDISNGRYAFYAHLVPGSLRVQVGDHVRRGDVLARLGNSGNSTEPHLHFHVVNGPSGLAAEGVPYAFASFAVVPGKIDESGEDIVFRPTGGPAVPYRDSLVLENSLIDFGAP